MFPCGFTRRLNVSGAFAAVLPAGQGAHRRRPQRPPRQGGPSH